MPPEGDTLVLFLSDELEHEVGFGFVFFLGWGFIYVSRQHQVGSGFEFLLRSRMDACSMYILLLCVDELLIGSIHINQCRCCRTTTSGRSTTASPTRSGSCRRGRQEEESKATHERSIGLGFGYGVRDVQTWGKKKKQSNHLILID